MTEPGAAEDETLDTATLRAMCDRTEMPTEDEAVALAQTCDTAVEVAEQATSSSEVLVNPDGTYTVNLSTQPFRTDVNGEWEPVDPTLHESGGEVRVAAPVVPMAFSAGGEGPLARIGEPGTELVIDAPMALPPPSVEGVTLTYHVAPGVDLIVTVEESASTFTQVFRVASPEAVKDAELEELQFDVSFPDDHDLRAADGIVELVDPAGDVIISTASAHMWDSSGDAVALERLAETADLPGPLAAALAGTMPSTAPVLHPVQATEERQTNPVAGDAVAVVDVALEDDSLEIRPDDEMLLGSETVWPVYIDPSVTASVDKWAAVRNSLGTKWKFEESEGVGLCDRGTTTTCSHTVKSRLLYEFKNIPLVAERSCPGEWCSSFACCSASRVTMPS